MNTWLTCLDQASHPGLDYPGQARIDLFVLSLITFRLRIGSPKNSWTFFFRKTSQKVPGPPFRIRQKYCTEIGTNPRNFTSSPSEKLAVRSTVIRRLFVTRAVKQVAIGPKRPGVPTNWCVFDKIDAHLQLQTFFSDIIWIISNEIIRLLFSFNLIPTTFRYRIN
jgi:hypothetical protein